MSDIRIFKRYEKKYLLTKEQYEGLMAKIGDDIRPDEYPEGLIQNIYYDTPDFWLIRESIEKPIYKEKLRLRCYGTISHENSAYLEVKKKYDGVVYKRREKMKVLKAMDYVDNPPEEADTQIGRELAYMIKHYGGLEPGMYICYHRLAFVYPDMFDVRMTFDDTIMWRRDHMTLMDGPGGEKLLNDGEVLMEIKTVGAMPLKLVRALQELNIYPASFSKYGTAYKNWISKGEK